MVRLDRRNNAMFCRYISFAIAFAISNTLSADVIVHETFSDNDILDDSPSIWEYSCRDPFGGCTNSSIEIMDGDAEVSLQGFAMWSFASAMGPDGQVVQIEPDNNWSIRARITGQSSGGSLPGVGIDSYHWAGGMYLPNLDSKVAGLALGNAFSSDGGTQGHDFFEPWVIQLDVFPDRLEAYRWPADNPGNISRATWSDGSTITPGRPVFWGNWGGKPIFHEVVVADSPMGIGGDFDLSDELDFADLNRLTQSIQLGDNDPRFNLTNDEVVDLNDLEVWITDLKETKPGDTNLDGSVDFEDFLTLSANFGGDGDWSQGDFNADGSVTFPDFLILSGNFGPSAAAVQSVPEPHSYGAMLTFAGLAVGCFRRPR